MLTVSYLLDSFNASGNDAEEFMKWCKAIDEHTEHQNMKLKKHRVLSILPEAREIADLTGAFPVWELNTADPVNAGSLIRGDFDITAYVGKEFLTDEAYDTGLILQNENAEYCFVSLNAFNTLGQRIDCDVKTLSHRNVGRDILLAERMGQTDKEATFVVKKADGIKKLFAVMSDKYAQVPLETISDIVYTLTQPHWLGKAECRGWTIDHKKVEIDFAFPEYADQVSAIHGLRDKLIPCVRLMTSDIGECSFTAKGYWLLGNNIIPDLEFSREHKGGLNSDKLYSDVENNIFYKYTKLPELLAHQMLVDITDPQMDLTSTEGRAENRALILKMYNAIFDKLNFKEILGQRRLEELIECIDYTYIDESMHYTGYDLCMDMFALPEQLKSYMETQNMGETTLKKLQKSVSRTAQFDFSSLKEKTEKEQKVYMTAA